MSLSSETARQLYNGNGALTEFAVPFYFEVLAVDVDAYLISALGVATQLTYVVGSTPGAGEFALVDTVKTGRLYTAADVKVNSAPAADEKILILRGTPLKQTTVITGVDGVPPKTVELAADRIVMMIQKLEERMDRMLAFRVGYTGTGKTIEDPEEGKTLVWDASGNLVNADVLEGGTTDIRSGVDAIANGATSKAIAFGNAMPSDDYAVSIAIKNTADSNPIILDWWISAQSASGFTISFAQPTDSSNYSLSWKVMEATE